MFAVMSATKSTLPLDVLHQQVEQLKMVLQSARHVDDPTVAAWGALRQRDLAAMEQRFAGGSAPLASRTTEPSFREALTKLIRDVCCEENAKPISGWPYK